MLSVIMILGNRIRGLRRQRGLSLLEMEKRTGVKKEYLCRIETSALPNPTYKMMHSIAQGLGVELISFFETSTPLPRKIKLFSPTEPTIASQSLGWVAIPIINQQLVYQQLLSLLSSEAETWALIPLSFIPPSANISNYRAFYLDDDDCSMVPVISPGSLICVDLGSTDIPLLVGKPVLMKDDEARYRIGYLKTGEDVIVGMPHNLRYYSPFIIPRHRKDSVLGRIVSCFNCLPTT